MMLRIIVRIAIPNVEQFSSTRCISGFRLQPPGSWYRRWSAAVMPNLVKVTYTINGKQWFVALIACTPLEAGSTLAHVLLRYHFGWPDQIIRLFIGRLTRKVLLQDWEITSDQFSKMALFADSKEHKVGPDAVAYRVKKLREQWIDGQERSETSSQKIQLVF